MYQRWRRPNSTGVQSVLHRGASFCHKGALCPSCDILNQGSFCGYKLKPATVFTSLKSLSDKVPSIDNQQIDDPRPSQPGHTH